MTREAKAGRRRRPILWGVATLALAATIVGVLRYSRLPSRESVFAEYSVPMTRDAERLVAESLLVRIPIGAPLRRVTEVLDSLGFVPASQFVSQAHYRVHETNTFVLAVSPYRESPLRVTHWVCDAPALRVSIRLDSVAHVVGVRATTARGCV